MNEQKTEQIKSILKSWNPLGTAAERITDLNDYDTEVGDILFHLAIDYEFPEKKVTQKQVVKIVKEVLNEAFNLYLTSSDCDAPCEEVLRVLNEK